MQGIFFLLVGPSGVGKGTVLNALRKDFADDNRFFFPITATTRTPRDGEKDGKDYFFITKESFEAGLAQNDFLEHAIVHGENYYGLPKKQVLEALDVGKNIIRELDIQGLWNLQKVLPEENLFSIFLLPPSMEILEKRIKGRSTLPEEEIVRRMESAKNEIIHSRDCNISVVSEDGAFEKVKISIKNIVLLEMEKRKKLEK